MAGSAEVQSVYTRLLEEGDARQLYYKISSCRISLIRRWEEIRKREPLTTTCPRDLRLPISSERF